jgi:hypothetical protein
MAFWGVTVLAAKRLDRGILDRTVHSLRLAVGPGITTAMPRRRRNTARTGRATSSDEKAVVAIRWDK